MLDGQIDVLLVEDNPDDEFLTLRALRKDELAQRIQVVRDGEEALAFIFGTGAFAGRDVSRPPRVVLLDLKLPKVNGVDVLRQIRAHPMTCAYPVVVLTSSREEQDVVESYHLGVNSYIVKPVDYTQFTEAVRHVGYYWLRLNQPPPPEPRD